MYARLLKTSNEKSFFLLGPRGTGKSTWVRKKFQKAVILDLLDSEIYTDLLAQPNRLANYLPKNFRDWVVLDEVQKIPALLNEVHRLIENEGIKFILTGSSARSLRKKGVNLLGGRALTYHMHPLTAVELGDDFNLNHSLQFGHLPCAYNESDPQAYLKSYVQTYLREEVQQEGLTRNLGTFSRFLEKASFSQGSVLNVSNVAKEVPAKRKLVENYFNILEDLLLGTKLQVFTKRAKRRMVAHPKFYFFDVGIYRSLRPRGPLDSSHEIEGIAFESLVFQELRAHRDYRGGEYDIYFWRTSNNTEVDFILYGSKGIKAIEVKRAEKFESKDLSALNPYLPKQNSENTLSKTSSVETSPNRASK